MNRISTHPRKIIDVVLSFLLAAVPVYLYYVAIGHKGDDRLFLQTIFFWYIGAILILSTRYAGTLYLFGLLDYVCTKMSVIGGKHRATIYGVMFIIAGAISIFRWFAAG